ncbi:MAG: tryptophan synthase subunit alpha [Myxococcota bacterium]|nr:tryptophan synthase subunit alpha [Myxococcota bacterium]
MSRIGERFADLQGRSRKAFVPYITAGFPSLETSLALARMLERNGADVLELGVPFTDPIADGPTNQRAAQKALDQGVTPGSVLGLVRELRSTGFELPIVLFTYSNPLLRLLARPEGTAQLEGVDGILVTDLPPEEADEHIACLRAADIDTIFLAAPTSPDERLARVARASRGFVYYVSSAGVTGVRTELPSDLESRVDRLRENTDLPICVGFGIGSREMAGRVCSIADGYVVGSALGRVIEEADTLGEDPVEAAAHFVRSLDPR